VTAGVGSNAVLDWVHKVTLQDVAAGEAEDSPALRTLVASGLVEQQPNGGHVITEAGRIALEDDAPSRLERILWPILAGCAAVYVVVTVVDWVSNA
jgi:hypothetical protein